MNESREKYWNLMAKSFSGTLSQTESSELKNWLAEDEANRKLLQELETVWTETESYGQEVKHDVDAAWNSVATKLGLEQNAPVVKGKPKVFHLARFTKIAAAVLILVVVGLGIYQSIQRPQLIEIATIANERK